MAAEEHKEIFRNLGTLAVIKRDDRLRLIARDNTDPGRVTVQSHFLALEDRWWFQGLRRTLTGDSGRTAIAFIQTELMPAVKNLARDATDAQRSGEPSATLFELTPVATLQKLSLAVHNAVRGVHNLKHSTYGSHADIGVELKLIADDMASVVQKINDFVEGQMRA